MLDLVRPDREGTPALLDEHAVDAYMKFFRSGQDEITAETFEFDIDCRGGSIEETR